MKRKPLIILASLATLLLVLTLAAPWVVKYQLRQQLLALGAEQAEIERLYLNIWSGHFNLSNLSVRGDGAPELKVGYLETDLEMGALFKRRLHLDHLYLYDSQIPLAQAGALWVLGPLQLPGGEAPTEPPPSEPNPWTWGLSALQLKNLTLEARLQDHTERLVIDEGDLNLLQNWVPLQESLINLSGQLNGSPFAIGSTATPLASEPKASSRLTIDKLALGPLTAPWLAGIDGELSADLELRIAQDEQGLSIERRGLLTLDRFSINQDGLALSGDNLAWRGNTLLRIGDGLSAKVDGELALSGLSLAQGELELAVQALRISGPLDYGANGSQQLTHNGEFSLDGLQLNQPDLGLKGNSVRWQGDSDLRIVSGASPSITTNGDLTLGGIVLALPDLDIREQQLALTGRLQTDLKQLAFEGRLDTQPSTLGLPHLDVATGSRHWQGQLTADIEAGALSALSGELALAGIAVKDKQAAPLASLARLELPRFEVGPELAFEAPQLTLGALKLEGETPLLSLSGVDARGLSGGPTALTLERLELGALDTGVTLNTEGEPRQWLDWTARLSPPPQADAAQTSAPSADAPAAAPFRVRVGHIDLQQPATLAFRDSTVKPARELTTTLNTLTLTDIDTGGSQPVGFDLDALINRYGTLALNGRYAAFADKPDGNWKGSIKQLELPPFSPYMQRYSGYQLRSGQMALDTSGTVAKGQVESQNALLIHNLQVQKRAEKDAGEFDQQLGMPLTTAISILTDDDNNVALDVPVKGAIDDPQFGYQSVINILMTKVAKEGAVTYLSSALQPYGALISLTRMAIKAGNAIDLAPVKFAPGSSELDAQALDYLGKIGSMMSEREGIRVNLCGLAVATDAQALQAQFRARQLEELQQTQAATSEAIASLPPMPQERLDAALLELAESRGDRVKNHLLGQAKIDAERLFSCLPGVDPESDTAPRVQLGL